MHNLFSYGSLQNPAVVKDLLGRELPTKPAQVKGFRVVQNAYLDKYPVAVKCPGCTARGVVLFNLNDEELQLLDNWEDITGREDDFYKRIKLVADIAGNEEVPVYMYVKNEGGNDGLGG